MVGIFLFWQDQQKHLLPVFLFSTQNSLVYYEFLETGLEKGVFCRWQLTQTPVLSILPKELQVMRKASEQPLGY